MDSVAAFFERMDRGEGDPKPLPRWMRRKIEKAKKPRGYGCHIVSAKERERMRDPMSTYLSALSNPRSRLPYALRLKPGRKT